MLKKNTCPRIIVALSITTAVLAQPGGSPFTRDAFDRLDKALNNGDGFKTGLGGSIAWGESYIMLAYVDMYRATQDTCYLDKLVDHADHVLASRDDNRGFRDYSGRSRCAWSVGGKYTVAELLLKDTRNAGVLKFRSTPYAFNDETTIRVTTRPADDRFDLLIANKQWKKSEEYKSLSLDRNSPDFAEKKINQCGKVAIERKLACSDDAGSNLVTVQVLDQGGGSAVGVPARDEKGNSLGDREVQMIPLVMAYHGYSGQATFGMLDFAYVVKNNAKLREKYGSHADRYIAECVKVFADADADWRSGPEPGAGHYVTGEHGCPFWSDGIGKAHNYQASLGRSLIRLGQLTGDRRWQQHAEGVARLIKNHLRVADNGTYVWNYWWGLPETGWMRENSPSFNTPVWTGTKTIEDTSHGHLEIDFISLAAHANVVFNDADMHRFANTFLKNVVDHEKWTMNDRVDGKSGWGQHNAVLGGWLELAAWDRDIIPVALRIAETHKLHESPNGGNIMTLARLIKWSN